MNALNTTNDQATYTSSYVPLYVLKIIGKHGLVFKTKHPNPEYLKQLAETQLNTEGTMFTEYNIHPSDHSNAELTQSEFLIHFTHN